MTLEEKVAQLGSRWIGGGLPDAEVDPGQEATTDGDTNRTVAPMQEVFAAGGRCRSKRRAGTGSALTRIFGSAPVTAVAGAEELVRQQRVVLDASASASPRWSTRSA